MRQIGVKPILSIVSQYKPIGCGVVYYTSKPEF